VDRRCLSKGKKVKRYKGKNMATKVLDITKEHCPMTFVKTKIELAKLQPGDILEVLLAEGEPLDNVPRNAREQGYHVLSVEHVEGTTHKVTIKK
jgi:TusA-related sulfurtransferase